MLERMLDFYRATAANKVGGLTDTQAFTNAVPPSTLTPASLDLLREVTDGTVGK